MKCPKCSYVSYDYLDACRKCGRDLINFKREVGLQVIRPGDLDLSLVVSGSAAAGGGRDDFNLDANFFGGQLFGQGGTAEADEAEFDISLDDDFPLPQATAPPAALPPEEPPEDDDTLLLDDTTTAVLETVPLPPTAAGPPVTANLTVDLIDMSDLEDLDEVAQDLQASSSPPASGAVAPPDDTELTIAETLETTRSTPPGRIPVPAEPEDIAELMADDLLDTEIELELDALDENKASEANTGDKTELLLDLDKLGLHDDDEPDNPRPPERK